MNYRNELVRISEKLNVNFQKKILHTFFKQANYSLFHYFFYQNIE
jgi:hypothetical protein